MYVVSRHAPRGQESIVYKKTTRLKRKMPESKPEDEERDKLASVFFEMGKSLKKNAISEIMQELQVYESSGLSEKKIQQRLVQAFRQRIDKERSPMSEIMSKLEKKHRAEVEEGPTALLAAPIRAASQQVIEVFEQCIKDLEEPSMNIQEKILLCRQRLQQLRREIDKD